MKVERRLMEVENRVLRRTFGPKRDEVRGEWRKLHNEEFNELYCSPNFVRGDKSEKNEIGRACIVYGGEKRCMHVFGGET
jgi:hypothetical protein